MADNKKELRKIIKRLHGCDSRHIESVPVTEIFRDEIAWQGVVEVFELIDHEKSKRCYAWSFQDGKTTRSIAVLEIPPVNSPQTAVKIAIANEAKKQRRSPATE